MSSSLKGVITALITPFKGGEIDFNSLTRLLRSQLDQGVDGFVVNGTTAESPTLQPVEVRRVFDAVKSEVAGQVPLLVGTGSNCTARSVEFTREVAGWGADAALVVVPYYNKPPQRGLRRHFEAVARASDLPVVLYNVPGRTVAALEPATVGELSANPKIAGIKDATGDMNVLREIQRLRAREDFALLSGDDATCVEFCARGGHGVIAVASHLIGREMRQAVARAWSGDTAAGTEYRDRYGRLFKWLYCEANPIPVKQALHFMGLIDSPELRLPLVPLDERYHKDLKTCLAELGKI